MLIHLLSLLIQCALILEQISQISKRVCTDSANFNCWNNSLQKIKFIKISGILITSFLFLTIQFTCNVWMQNCLKTIKD